MKNIKSHFNFTKQQKSGIFFLLLFLVILQIGYFILRYYPVGSAKYGLKLDSEHQKVMDSLMQLSKQSEEFSLKPFNPNYINDFKGYTLGMSPAEIDRLHEFRSKGKFVNSVADFQRVTRVSDSLLKTISPFFKFPDWVVNSAKKDESRVSAAPITIKDLNTVTSEDLKRIRGIGEKLSARIIKFRDGLGGFIVGEQLYDVYGLKPEVADKVLSGFKVLHPPDVTKININTASVEELASLAYLRYHVAENIVNYRLANGAFDSLEDLFNVPKFPVNKIDRIGLYLTY